MVRISKENKRELIELARGERRLKIAEKRKAESEALKEHIKANKEKALELKKRKAEERKHEKELVRINKEWFTKFKLHETVMARYAHCRIIGAENGMILLIREKGGRAFLERPLNLTKAIKFSF